MSLRPGPTVEEYARALRDRRISAVEATNDCLRRIESSAGPLNAFILVAADTARAEAQRADDELASGRDRGPLHGVPVSLKDLIDVQGTPTTAASRVRQDHRAAGDAPLVTLLRRAGAVIVGKTNLHEFAFGTTSEDSAFGPVRHPLDLSRSAGGSSGGSAVSVATGMALASVGTDTGGSIRIPAAACGIVGLKPTHGEVSAEGVVPLSGTLDHVGPLARDVTDAWHLYRALTGRTDAKLPAPAPAAGLRLGLPQRHFCDVLEDGVRDRFEAAISTARAAGARFVDVDIPLASAGPAIYLHIVLSEAAAYHAAALDSVPDRYTPAVRERLELGRYVLAEDYVRALAGRELLRRQVDAALSSCDALVLPTLPIVAPPIGAGTARVAGADHPVRNLMLRLTQTFNLTGHPAISLPCGSTAEGLPCGLQLVGARMHTEGLLKVAAGLEPVVSR